MGKKDRRQKVGSRGQKEKLKVKSGRWKVKVRLPNFLIPKDEPIVPRPFTAIDYAGGIGVFFIC